MRVLLTGASGFIGSALLGRFVREGWEVDAIHRKADAPTLPGVRWHSIDLWQTDATNTLLKRIKPTQMVLNAWIATPSVFWSSPDNTRWLEATTSLLQAFGECGGKQVAGLGSCAEYDWDAEKFIEDQTPERPHTLYGQSKLAACRRMFAMKRTYGFHAAWGRIFMPYGPGDAPQRLIPSVIDHLRRGQPMPLSKGLQIRDFIYVDDIAEAVMRLLRTNADGIFNLGTGIDTSIRNMAITIADQLNASRDLLKFGALEERPEPASLVADVSKLRHALGWQPEISVESGTARLLATSAKASRHAS